MCCVVFVRFLVSLSVSVCVAFVRFLVRYSGTYLCTLVYYSGLSSHPVFLFRFLRNKVPSSNNQFSRRPPFPLIQSWKIKSRPVVTYMDGTFHRSGHPWPWCLHFNFGHGGKGGAHKSSYLRMVLYFAKTGPLF